MVTPDAVVRGRESFSQRAWRTACDQFRTAGLVAPLELQDLERLAVAAFLVGDDDASATAWAHAHQACLRIGDVTRAARDAFWLAFGLINRGEVARGNGWLARARRVLGDAHADCVEQGYLLMPSAIEVFTAGDPATAHAMFERAGAVAEQFGDADLMTLARTGQGRALIRMGHTAEGIALLDEVMVAVIADAVSPILVGATYCSVMDACQEIFDLHRAREWTVALSHWCTSQPDLVPFRGQCMVYRSEIMQIHGSWSDAVEEARRACDWLSTSPGPATGSAFYQRAELHRLRGEFAKAERAYRRASQFGRTPQPGLALLRLAQGQLDAAAAAIRLAVGEASDRLLRAKMLAAHTEIMLAVGEVAAARSTADELAGVAADLDVPFLRAVAAHAAGAVLLAEGDAHAALNALRHAWAAWQTLEAPYNAARARLMIGLAYRSLGDHDTAAMELDAARWVFRQLGAIPDAIRVENLLRPNVLATPCGLTEREVEVLRHVAAGQTNRAIADDLFLSERTIDRHVSNIFTKLGVSSRAAATAFAVENDLA